MKKTIFAILSVGVFTLSACSSLPAISIFATATPTPTPIPPTATPIPFAISVNGVGISPDEYRSEVERLNDSAKTLGQNISDTEKAAMVQKELVSELLLAQGAYDAGFTFTDDELQAKIDDITKTLGSPEKYSEWLSTNHYTDETFRAALRRTTAAAWMRDAIAEKTPKNSEQVLIQEMLLYDEDSANYYFDQLQNGQDFNVLASQIDPITRGIIGWFPRNYIPDKLIEESAFALEVGQTTNVIKGDVGYYILKSLDKQTDKELSPDALAALQKIDITKWLEEKTSSAEIQINP